MKNFYIDIPKRVVRQKINDLSPDIQDKICYDYIENRMPLGAITIKYGVQRKTLVPFFKEKGIHYNISATNWLEKFGQENAIKAIEMYNSGIGSIKIAKCFNKTYDLIIKVLKANNIEIRKNDEYFKYNKLNNEIIELYKYGYNKRFIARKLNICHITVTACLNKNNVPQNKSNVFISKYAPEIIINLINDYNSGFNILDLYKKYNIEKTNIIKIIKINDDKIVSIFRKSKVYCGIKKEHNDLIFTNKQIKEIIHAYLSRIKSIKNICKEYNISRSSLFDILKTNQIKPDRKKHFTNKQMDEIINIYISKTKSVKYIIETYGIKCRTFYNELKKRNIEPNIKPVKTTRS